MTQLCCPPHLGGAGRGFDNDFDDVDEDGKTLMTRGSAGCQSDKIVSCGAFGCTITTATGNGSWGRYSKKGKELGIFCKTHLLIALAFQCDGLTEEEVQEKLRVRDPTTVKEVSLAEKILSGAIERPWEEEVVCESTSMGLRIFDEVIVIHERDWVKHFDMKPADCEDIVLAKKVVPLNGAHVLSNSLNFGMSKRSQLSGLLSNI